MIAHLDPTCTLRCVERHCAMTFASGQLRLCSIACVHVRCCRPVCHIMQIGVVCVEQTHLSFYCIVTSKDGVRSSYLYVVIIFVVRGWRWGEGLWEFSFSFVVSKIPGIGYRVSYQQGCIWILGITLRFILSKYQGKGYAQYWIQDLIYEFGECRKLSIEAAQLQQEQYNQMGKVFSGYFFMCIYL